MRENADRKYCEVYTQDSLLHGSECMSTYNLVPTQTPYSTSKKKRCRNERGGGDGYYTFSLPGMKFSSIFFLFFLFGLIIIKKGERKK